MNNNFRGSILRVSKYGNLREGRNQNLREEQVSTASSKKSNKKMAMNDDKMTGAGAERRETSTTNHPGRGNGTNKKKQGTQGRGGRGGRGFFTPPRPRRSSRILQQDERDETKADVTTDINENELAILFHEEEEEPDNEATSSNEKMAIEEGSTEMQIDEKHSPRKPAAKRQVRDDPSVGSLQRTASRGRKDAR